MAPLNGTLVPITLANGRQEYLFIPQKQTNDPHAVYLRDEQGLHPVRLSDNVSRDELARSPGIVETRPAPKRLRSGVAADTSNCAAVRRSCANLTMPIIQATDGNFKGTTAECWDSTPVQERGADNILYSSWIPEEDVRLLEPARVSDPPANGTVQEA